MKRSEINPMPEYWGRYISLVPDVELSQAFDDSIRQLETLDKAVLGPVAGKTYSPGKWTIKDIVQHLIDGERIMCYRALMFARRDPTIPPSFEQNDFAVTANANRRTFDDLIDELLCVRRATKALYDSFNDEMLKARGMNWETEVSVLDVGFLIVGHQIHHFNVIAERYSALQ
jgi:hypothetical protein